MSRLRLLFACLLIAAIPLQGFAAASMLFCGMGAPPSHAAMQAHTMDADTPHDHTTLAQAGGSQDFDQACSICAASCHAVALVGLPHTITTASTPQAELADPFVLIHAMPSPVPDKPPRA